MYVDNILILALDEEIKRLHALAVDEFRWVTIEIGEVLYIGMKIWFAKEGIWIDMENYLRNLLAGFECLINRSTPAEKELLDVRNEDFPL
jgi:hypothetical protein